MPAMHASDAYLPVQQADRLPAPPYRAQLTEELSYPFECFDAHQPNVDLTDGHEPSPPPASVNLLFTPWPRTPLDAAAPVHHMPALPLPPAMSLFPSMSAVDDAFNNSDSHSVDLQPFTQPVHFLPPSPTIHAAQPLTELPPSTTSSPAVPSSSSSSSSGDSRSNSPTPAPPKHVREQRKLSKRLKQRRADLHRRTRETAALNEMKELIAAAQQLTATTTTDSTASTTTAAAEELSSQQQGTQHRVQILEGSAKRMRELQLLVNLLSQTVDAQQREIRALTHKLGDSSNSSLCPPDGSVLPTCSSLFEQPTSVAMSSAAAPSKRLRLLASSVSSAVHGTIGHQSLQSARFSPAVLGAMLVDCSSGVVMDINEGMVVQGWQRSQIVGRTVMEGYEAVVDEKGWQLGEHLEQRLLVPSQTDGQLRPAGRPAQYERSKRLMRELYAGNIGVCVAIWRVYMFDGLQYEVQTSTWIDGWESIIDSSGRMSRRPLRSIAVTSLGDIHRLD